ncbi:hypothetical protein B0H10DRAFT_1949410 [Mycena sp. CBHHK59/15]|nr:hypothetical protein B0H10DRAFT_1949410 [Mycena sp. CBHHK59/15]
MAIHPVVLERFEHSPFSTLPMEPNGTANSWSAIKQYPCPAERSIYVPLDLSIRKALIITNATLHNHPMPLLTKVSLELKEAYRECIKANGCFGATVSKVDNAKSTKLILKGKTLSQFASALYSKCVKRDLLCAFHLYLTGLTKLPPEHYIHGYITTADGGICILSI